MADNTPDTDGFLKIFQLFFDLNKSQMRLVFRIGWVLLVTFHILWICGWLAFMGLEAPYAHASDMAALQRSVQVTEKITLSQEIRSEMVVRCRTKDQDAKDSISRYIESLQNEYWALTHERYPEVPCANI